MTVGMGLSVYMTFYITIDRMFITDVFCLPPTAPPPIKVKTLLKVSFMLV